MEEPIMPAQANETLGDRIRARRLELDMSQGQLAKQVGLTQPTISSLERNESKVTSSIGSIAHALNVSALWLETGLGDKKIPSQQRGGFRRTFKGGTDLEFEIAALPSKGSCGGNTAGKPDIEDIQAALLPIFKDQAFFDRFNVEPCDVVAIIADGDSGANFIMHGDTVFFRTSLDRLESGLIYAFDTPDGPRIKRVHRRSDGHIILSCDNPDKVRYPDEEYTADAAAGLTVIGKYFYRQG